MFSQLTLKSLRIFFTYFSTWNTPFKWNTQTQEIEFTSSKSQLRRWKLSLVFTFGYTFFIIIRIYQSIFYTETPMNQVMTLEFPQLLSYTANLFAVVTISWHAKDIVFIFKQMARNNWAFGVGEKIIHKKWDGLGIFISYMNFVTLTYPYVFGCFFYFNRHGSTFLYSLVFTSGQANPDPENVGVALAFVSIEVISIHCISNSIISLHIITCTYFVHSTYWMRLGNMSFSRLTADQNVRKFQILLLLTSKFNEAFSNVFLVPLKGLICLTFVVSNVTLIRFHNTLQFGTLLILEFMSSASFIILVAIYNPAGWVWKSSFKFKNGIGKEYCMEKKRINSLRPFGINIGSSYLLKSITFLSITNILMKYILRLLVALK